MRFDEETEEDVEVDDVRAFVEVEDMEDVQAADVVTVLPVAEQVEALAEPETALVEDMEDDMSKSLPFIFLEEKEEEEEASLDEEVDVGEVREAIISLTDEEAEVLIPDEAVMAGERESAVANALGFLATGILTLTWLDGADSLAVPVE